MRKHCHFLSQKTKHVLKVQILMRGLSRDGLLVKLVEGRPDLLS